MNYIVGVSTPIEPRQEDKSCLSFFIHNVLHTQKTEEEYWFSHERWGYSNRYRASMRNWQTLNEGGTGIMRVLMWYHHVHKPGSKEWRPTVIIRAVHSAHAKWLERES